MLLKLKQVTLEFVLLLISMLCLTSNTLRRFWTELKLNHS
jgi:hypothetical protein